MMVMVTTTNGSLFGSLTHLCQSMARYFNRTLIYQDVIVTEEVIHELKFVIVTSKSSYMP